MFGFKHGRRQSRTATANLDALGAAAPYAAWAILVVAFVLDWRLPADINVGAFYAVAVLLAAVSRARSSIWLTALASVVLIVAAAPLGPPSSDPSRPDWVVWLNRSLMGAVVLMLAGLSERLVRTLEALADANRTLEARVVERTREREAALARLHEAQKAEALGQLTGGVAHDFSNLLTIITGGLDLLGRRLDGQPQLTKYVDAAMAGADRAKALIDRLMAFARRQEPQVKPVDLAALIRNLRPLVAYSVGSRIEISIDLPDVAMAWADHDRLELSILNLAVNARDAMPDGGQLSIGVRGEADDGHVCLTVADTGFGMDDVTRAQAIEPLFTTKPLGKGTGLGLSMAHNLARQLGGRLAIHSSPGKGTTVEFWLRRADRGAPPSPGVSRV